MPRKAARKKTGDEPINQLGRLLTVDEAATLIGVGRAKISELISSGRLKAIVIGPRIRRIRMSALQHYVDSL